MVNGDLEGEKPFNLQPLSWSVLAEDRRRRGERSNSLFYFPSAAWKTLEGRQPWQHFSMNRSVSVISAASDKRHTVSNQISAYLHSFYTF